MFSHVNFLLQNALLVYTLYVFYMFRHRSKSYCAHVPCIQKMKIKSILILSLMFLIVHLKPIPARCGRL